MRLARARRRRAELGRVRVLPVHLYRPAALIHTRVQHDVGCCVRLRGARLVALDNSAEVCGPARPVCDVNRVADSGRILP